MAIGTLERFAMTKDRKPATATIKIDPDLLKKAQQVCAFTQDEEGNLLKLSDFFDSLIRDSINRKHAQLMKKLSKGGSPESTGTGEGN